MPELPVIELVCPGCEDGALTVVFNRKRNEALIDNVEIQRTAFAEQIDDLIDPADLHGIPVSSEEVKNFLIQRFAREVGSISTGYVTQVICAGPENGVCGAKLVPAYDISA